MANGFMGNIFGGGRNQNPGAGQQQADAGGQGDDQNLDDAGFQNGERGESGDEVDPGALLAGFFQDSEQLGGGEGNDQNQNQNQNQNQPPNNQQPNNNQNQNQNQNDPDSQLATQVATEVNNLIKGISAPDDMIPEDFNPADPTQMRSVLTRAMQHSAMNAMQITFKPMQVAMRQLAADIQQQIRDELSGFGDKQSSRQILARIVPEVESKEHGALAQGLFDQAMKRKGATAESAARMVRNALDNFGIGKSRVQNQNNGTGDPFSGGFKTGDAALDTFAPLPRPRNNQNQQRK